MLNKIKNISSKAIISFTAIGLISLYIILGFYRFAVEKSAIRSGSMTNCTYAMEDFTLLSFRQDDGHTVTSTDNDPQMIMAGEMTISTIEFSMESTIFPGEMVMYYTTKEGEPFSERKRVWAKPVQGKENQYIIEMPAKKVMSIRIDPTMYRGNRLIFSDFEFNSPKSFFDYFAVSYSDVFTFLLYTGLISSVLRFIQEFFTKKFE